MTGDELKRQRGRMRLTQRELADRIGVELIAELARRLGLPRVGTNASPTVEETTAGRASTEEDYPSDASALGIVGTPTNGTSADETTTAVAAVAWRQLDSTR